MIVNFPEMELSSALLNRSDVATTDWDLAIKIEKPRITTIKKSFLIIVAKVAKISIPALQPVHRSSPDYDTQIEYHRHLQVHQQV